MNIKAIATIILSTCLVSIAQAGNYSDAVSRGRFCSSMGGMARTVFEARQRGEPKQKYLDLAASAMNTGDRGDAMIRFAIDYGYDQATDGKDAHMKAWANCMDQTY